MTTTPASLLATDEVERLRTLRYYDILHSLHEQIFDEFVHLAARIFSLPISLIALVDEDQVEYKANHGMPGMRAQPRVEALCSVAIQQNKAVVVKDVAAEIQLPITDEARQAAHRNNLRFYAGAPLRMPDQRTIGTLCVIDRNPRSFSAEEQHVLDQLAGLVAQTIAVRHFCLVTTELGEDCWKDNQRRLIEEVHALVALVRYVNTRYGAQVPVSHDVLTPVSRRMNDLREILQNYSQQS
ncbi:GAF domain-containing protein [Hymenobacter puniceus]|uniref:GAF domain-containing protein n=1 Tax=Hymenobacter sp. BT190 TaxID=2763505 RepID=UPI001651265A|nr:GAF domain-containing protein [Hymenobacter sp. BT190]MBC6700164.1 GAF domain-containing protein [Hymenobacter sp. BT190]